MSRRERKNFSDVVNSQEVREAKKRSANRAAKISKTPPKNTSLAVNWNVDGWIKFVESLSKEFDVQVIPGFGGNVYKKRNIYRNYVDNGTRICGTVDDLVVATANLFCTWEEEKYPFLRCRPSSFTVAYFAKALDSYCTAIQEDPLLQDSYSTISEEFTSRINKYLQSVRNAAKVDTDTRDQQTQSDPYHDKQLEDIL